MSENENVAAVKAPTPKPKLKVSLVFTGGGSYRSGSLYLKKNEAVEVETSEANELLRTGLFKKS